MTTAEKLQTVAENVSKVYEAGQEYVSSAIVPINAELEKILSGTDTGSIMYDEFWELFQNGGTRTYYGDAFRESSFEYIRPKYKIVPQSAMRMFYNAKSLKKVEAQYFDFSYDKHSTSGLALQSTFYGCTALTEIEDVGLSGDLYEAFYDCINLQTIARLKIRNMTTFSNAFRNCSSLENVTIDGIISQSGFNVQWSTKLSKASITSIINALSTTVSGNYKVTLSKTAVDNAFTEDEWSALISNCTNWTISLI